MKVTPLLAISFSLVASIALADNSAVTPAATPAVTAPKIVKPGEDVIDVDRTNTLVPMVVDECSRTPKAAFIKKEHEVSKKTIASTSTK